MEPNDYLHASLSKVLHYVCSVELLGEGEVIRRGCTIDHKILAVHGPHRPLWPTTYSFIQAVQ